MHKLYTLGLLVLFLSGCASYSNSFQKIESLLVQQKPQEALVELEKNPASGRDRLLYLLDKAMLQRMSGLFAESNTTFEEAKELIAALRATSLVEQAGAVTINDSAVSYEGEDFEQVLIHVYEALNYIELGQLDEARVEALQVDERLKQLSEGEDNLKDDAFTRYLTGLIYEAEYELDEAMIAYRKAYEAYQGESEAVPLLLKKDLLRLSYQLGLMDEFVKYKKAFDMDDGFIEDAIGRGEVIVLFHAGLAPIKRSTSVFVNTDDGVPVRISLPVYQSRRLAFSSARLTVGEVTVALEVMNDIDAIARASLESHKAVMVARLIARTMAKAAIARQAQKQGGEFAGLLFDVAAFATETADTRSWLTLPKRIYLSRLPMDDGKYQASLSLFGQQGELIRKVNLGLITVESGEKTFIEKTVIALPSIQ